MSIYTKKVIAELNRELDTKISTSFYSKIEYWSKWWEGYVSDFHRKRECMIDGTPKWRTLYSMNMAKKVCEDWASYLLNEDTRIEVVDAPESQAFVDSVLRSINFEVEANRLVEKANYSGTGAFVLKIDNLYMQNGEVITSDGIIRCDYLSAKRIIPISKQYGRITEAAFCSVRTERGKTFVYVETHMKEESGYVITNRKYQVGDSGKLIRVDLQQGIVRTFETGSQNPLFYIIMPNIENPYKNNMGLGCSIFAQAIDCLKEIDLVFNNLGKDFELGSKKVIYNRQMVGQYKVGNQTYDVAPDDVMQQLFYQVGDTELPSDKEMIYEFNPSLRVDENTKAIFSLMNLLSFLCGMGSNHYKLDIDRNGVVTATQYAGEKQTLKQNAAKHGQIITEALTNMIKGILWIGRNILGRTGLDPEAQIRIQFADGYITSDEEKRAEALREVNSLIKQPWEFRMEYYGETEQQAKQALGINTSITDTPVVQEDIEIQGA